MSLEVTILAIMLAGATALFAVFPLLERQPDRAAQPPGARRASARQKQALETLGAEKLRVLRAIRELDFDYDMDKLTDATYAAQRIELIRLVAAITQRMDQLEAEIDAQQQRIEAAVAALRRAR